jgi:hypothetical protein
MDRAKRWKTSIRIVWSVAAKDVLNALRSKTTLGILFGIALLMLNGHALQLLLGLREQPKAVVYDPARSPVVRSLAEGDGYILVVVDTAEEMASRVTDSPEVWLRIVLPADFDQAAGSGELLELPGYSVY